MKKDKLKMNLQMFGEQGGSDDADINDNPDNIDNGNNPDPTDKLPKTEDELQEIINKSVESRLAREKAKADAEIKRIKEKAKADAKKYADMTESEKEQAEIEDRIKELEAREKELNDRELLANIKSDLAEKNLPSVFADSLLVIQDNEKIKKAIGEIKSAWDEEIAEAIKASARQETPSANSRSYATKDKTRSKADFFNEGRKID